MKARAERLRKRSGHLLSKMRYVSAQLLAYLEDERWLQMAANANHQAAAFAAAVEAHDEAELEFPVEANEVFMRWSAEGFARGELRNRAGGSQPIARVRSRTVETRGTRRGCHWP